AELVVQTAAARHPESRFTSVRFGNVLGSSGSVVPIFRSQIERGGPVTVTDPEMTRYFMTIPEAVQLVIRAGDLGGGEGEIFVLEMGEPVRIIDLARNMIQLAGYEPDTDIPIEITGARAGEQLHERLLADDERSEPTDDPRITRAVRDKPVDPVEVERTLTELAELVGAGDETHLAGHVVELVSACVRTSGSRRNVDSLRNPN
ncbi:MAG: polysaccharide biosynthesis protein, partial [Solirubrobacterales bacterium]